MSLRTEKLFVLCGLLAAALAAAGCTGEGVDREGSSLADLVFDAEAGASGTGGLGGAACDDFLEVDCDPPGKDYTQEQIKACEAWRVEQRDLCVTVDACLEERAVEEQACYPKPPEGAPEREAFDACIAAAAAEFATCVGDGGGDGSGTGGGGGSPGGGGTTGP
jgi:hypothetical protein